MGLGGLENILREGYTPRFGAVELAEMADLVAGSFQAFDRMMGASFVTLSDRAAQDLAETGMVRAYPDTPRITIASSVISMSKSISQTAQLQVLDLLNDSVHTIAYPGQGRGEEKVYRRRIQFRPTHWGAIAACGIDRRLRAEGPCFLPYHVHSACIGNHTHRPIE